MAKLNFNARNVDPQQTFEPLPAGWYTAAITASDLRPTKDESGGYLLLELTIIEGEFKGRKVFDRLNLYNNNQTAVEIAQRQLAAICHATGRLEVQDSSELHNLPLDMKLALRAADGRYEASNVVKGYRAHATTPSPEYSAPDNPFAAAPATAPAAPAAPTNAAPVPPAAPTNKPAGSPPFPWAK